jgi:hypothetical protein
MRRHQVRGRARGCAVGALFWFLAGLLVACQFPPPTRTSPPPPTDTPTPVPSSTPTPSPLSEPEARALLLEELAARGVDPDTVKIDIREGPRTLSVRFTSAYDFESSVYRAQSILVALTVSRASLRLRPPLDGGIKLSIIPQGSDEVGLHVMSIMASSLDAWAGGSLTDQEFVEEWSVGIFTKE